MIQQRIGVGADGVETAVAEHQQTGQAHHHVEAEAQHHVDQRQGGDIHRAARDQERPGDRRDDEQSRQQLLPRRGAVEARQHERRAGDFFQSLLQQRAQQLEEKDDDAADADPHPAHFRRAVHHQLGAVQAELHAHQERRHHEQHRRGDQRIEQIEFHTFSTSGRPRMPVGMISSTTISSANDTTSLYSVLR